jgi:FKBP-type peptidyl-prolyl cis-trans isomerase
MSAWIPSPSGLQHFDHAPGAGASARKGAWVWVHYTGWLLDGKKFDSSRDRNEPFAFRLGVGDVIPAWDEAVAGMRVGGKREILAPPNLAYGAEGFAGLVPPGAWLRFEIEMLATQ